MRLHDRRTSLSALVLFAAYCATIGYGIALVLAHIWGWQPARPARRTGWIRR
jgi:hypothetical protein